MTHIDAIAMEYEVVQSIRAGIERWLNRLGNEHHIEMLQRNDWEMYCQQGCGEMLWDDIEAEDWLEGNFQRIEPMDYYFYLALRLIQVDYQARGKSGNG